MHKSTEETVATWTRVDLQRAVGLCLLAFVLLGTYAIARPTSESLFLKEYTSKALPTVWLAVALTALVVVALYNRYASWMPMLRLFGWVSLVSSGIVGCLLWGQSVGIRGATFALYVWKDVYIVVLVEVFWGYANQVFDLRKARWLYGLFCVMGSLGGLVANLGVGALARRWGTLQAAMLLIPLLFLMGLWVWVFERNVGAEIAPSRTKQTAAWGDGVRVVLRSPYLWLVFLLILCAQIATNSMDYQYNRMLEQTYPRLDQRTAVVGQVYAVIDVVAIVFQFLTGPILRWIGISATLLLIPATLLLSLGAYLAAPSFGMIAFAKIFDKSMGYSLFRAAKEILYLPLSHEEKTQGKAIVDVFSYRAAKGFASILLLFLVAWQWGHLLGAVSLALLGGWLLLTIGIVRRYRKLGEVSNAVDTASAND